MKTKEKVVAPDQEQVAWALLNAMANGVTLVDRNGNILLINETAAAQFARPVETLTGASIWNFYPPARLNYFKVLINQVMQTGQPISLNTQHEGGWSRTLIQPVDGETGQVDKVAICNWDITAQIEAEERYKRVALELITAQEDERRRISQDLHDEIGQRMTALTLDLRSIENALERDQKITVNEVNSTIRDLEAVIKQTHQVFYQLHPPSLDTVALPKVLAAFCVSFQNSTGMEVDFSCQEDLPKISVMQSTVIYRFVQEGLANVAKHASASRAWISLDYNEGELNISLEDDGKGFEPVNSPEGMGLHGIRERFQMLNGSVEVESSKGKGTRLLGILPLKPEDI
jgi:signal transduction histidine kinase